MGNAYQGYLLTCEKKDSSFLEEKQKTVNSKIEAATSKKTTTSKFIRYSVVSSATIEVNPHPTKVFFTTYLTKGVTITPLWKFDIKHPTFIKVVPGDSYDPLSNHTK